MRIGRLVILATALAGACTGAGNGSARVDVMAGGQAVPGATVLFHRADGSRVGRGVTDEDGGIAAPADADFADVVFAPRAGSGDAPTLISAALTDDFVLVVGPDPGTPVGPTAGKVTVTGSYPGSTYTIELGCTTVRTATLPITIDVPSVCLASDGKVTVIVLAINSDPAFHGQILATAGGRVAPSTTATAQLAAALQPASFANIKLDPTVGLDGCTWWGFGLPYDGGRDCASLGALATDGLQVDATRWSGTNTLELHHHVGGVPAELDVYTGDFLAETAVDARVVATSPWTVSISPPSGPTRVDALELYVQLDGPLAPTWFVDAPADVRQLVFPALDADVAAMFGAPPATQPNGRVTYLQSDALDGYTAFARAGVGFALVEDGDTVRSFDAYLR